MPTLAAPVELRSLRLPKESTKTDWPILLDALLFTDWGDALTRPTSNVLSFTFEPMEEPETAVVRRAVRRAIRDFGPAFDRLGEG